MSKKPLCSLIKCLREIIGLFDLIAVGNILWCQKWDACLSSSLLTLPCNKTAPRPWDVRFFYQQGPSMHLSDPLSRLSSHNTQDGNKEEVQGLKVNICDITSVKNVTLDQFKEHTASDEDFKLLKMYVMHGWPSAQQDCVEQLRSYFTFKEEISFIDGLLFKGNRLIVPKALRNKTLQVLHRSHMGIIKTQERATTSFYWPGLNIAIKSICQSCETCLQYAAKQDKQEIGLVPDCSESWEALATDIFEFQGKFFLIVSCRFSSYMVVREMTGHTAEETIDKLSSIFAELGLPRTLHCDRGTNYTSSKFQDFCKGLNIKVTYSSAEHHSSNYAERGVQTVKQFMRKTEEWQMALLEYLMTPIRLQGTQNSPLQLMKKRKLGVSYQLDNKAHVQVTMKESYPGDRNKQNINLVVNTNL